MDINEYLATRWGDDNERYVSPVLINRCDNRVVLMWAAIKRITGTTAELPYCEVLHSARGLPAVIKYRGRRRLVWDAGLGTYLNAMSFSITYAQPHPVVEALIRRIIGVRYLIAGFAEKAAGQVQLADALLRDNPIDRYHQIHSDAESQFEVWLVTEMQERFAVGHELAHHLKNTDRQAFDLFVSQLLDQVHRLAQAESREPSIFSANPYDENKAYEYGFLRAKDLDPWGWYLESWRAGSTQQQRTGKWNTTALEVLDAFGASPALLEEAACDILSSIAGGLDAHTRQNGWSAIAAVSCSRLALANLGVLLGVDEWVAGRCDRLRNLPADVDIRGACMDVVVPVMLPNTLQKCVGRSALQPSDVYDVMQFVNELLEDRVTFALDVIGNEVDAPCTEFLGRDNVLLRAGFLYMRPNPDSRQASEAALEAQWRDRAR